MKAVVWHGGTDYRLEDVPEPTPQPRQVIVKVEAAGVCGSDFHYHDWQCRPPIIPGHEAAGVVVELGSEVDDLPVGTAVALDPVQRCGDCACCRGGIGHLCPHTRHLGGERAPGTWAQYAAIDARNAHRLPAGLDWAAASLAEPAAVCRESFLRAAVDPDANVLVIGDGPFGYVHALWARQLPARVVVAGHYDQRLQRIAAATGALTCNTHNDDLQSMVQQATDGLGVDVVIEATGAAVAPALGIAALRPRGVLVIFSYIWNPRPPDWGAVSMKELTLVGACRSWQCFEPSLAAMADGRLPLDDLVDLEAPLTDFADALRAVKQRKAEIFKAVLRPWA